MIVLDASAAVNLFLEVSKGVAVAERLAEAGDVHVPAHFDVEVVATIRRLLLANHISEEHAKVALRNLDDMTASRWAVEAFTYRAFALRNTVAAGDAYYIALAEFLEAPLLSDDQRLVRSHGHNAQVIAP